MEEIGKRSLHTERRRYPCFELSQALAYQWGTARGTLRTVDVSLGGIKIRTDSPTPVDKTVELTLLLEYEAIRPGRKVVWSNPSSDGKYDVGISFETISPRCLKRLERFLEEAALREKLAKQEKDFDQSSPEGLESKPFESDRLRFNFLKWLHKAYSCDYELHPSGPKSATTISILREDRRSSSPHPVPKTYPLIRGSRRSS